MSNKESTPMLVLILGIITLVTAVILGFVNEITEPRIAAMKVAERTAAFADFFPTADQFKEADLPDGTTATGGYIAVDDAGNQIGCIVLIAPTGFGGPIEMAVGFDLGNLVCGFKLLSMSETSGIGTRVQDESFWGKFIGLSSFESIDTLSGATITSSAVLSGVTNAAAAASQLAVKP